jgi:hypothetical protein
MSSKNYFLHEQRNNVNHLRLEDFKDMTLKSLYFLRFASTVYVDDFNAGFYLKNASPGDQIQISLFSTYILPQFDNLEELLTTKPSEYILDGYDPHPTIKMDMAV